MGGVYMYYGEKGVENTSGDEESVPIRRSSLLFRPVSAPFWDCELESSHKFRYPYGTDMRASSPLFFILYVRVMRRQVENGQTSMSDGFPRLQRTK